MAEFAGFSMPIQYPTGTIEEHNYVRTRAGLFDVSHMGEIILRGPGAGPFLDYLLTNVMSNLKAGRIRYGVMCRGDGGALDDLIVCRLGEVSLELLVNRGLVEELRIYSDAMDWDWVKVLEKAVTGLAFREAALEEAFNKVQKEKSLFSDGKAKDMLSLLGRLFK